MWKDDSKHAACLPRFEFGCLFAPEDGACKTECGLSWTEPNFVSQTGLKFVFAIWIVFRSHLTALSAKTPISDDQHTLSELQPQFKHAAQTPSIENQKREAH